MSIKVTYQEGIFLAKCSFDDRKILENAKFKFDKTLPKPFRFYSTNPMSASLLRDHCDEVAKKFLQSLFIKRSPWKRALVVPEGKSLLEHQGPSALFSLRASRSYLGLDPGLGKTIIAAIIAATMGVPTLYICPPFLTLNTLEEFQTWAPSLDTKILGRDDWNLPDVLIVPDTMIDDEDVKEYLEAFEPQLLIGDEFHRYKSGSANRTEAMLGDAKGILPGIIHLPSLKKIVAMSGTPMPNRPFELYPVLSKLAPETINFMSEEFFGKRYCGAKFNGYAFEYKGASNMKELRERTLTTSWDEDAFVLRLYKDRLKLPPIIREAVVLGADMPTKLSSMESSILKQYSLEDLTKKAIAKEHGKDEDDLHLATYMRLLGLAKVKPAADYLNAVLEETEENLLIFGIHKEVIRELGAALAKWNPLIVTGDTNKNKRHSMVKEFQSKKSRRLFIGNIDAMGVGYTLTKANRVGFLEYSWGGYQNRQATDRVHRYGFKGKNLLEQYFVFRNSIDHTKLETLARKARITAYI